MHWKGLYSLEKTWWTGVCWVHPGWQPSTTQLIRNPPVPPWNRGENRNSKSEKIHGLNEDSLLSVGKREEQPNKWPRSNHSPPPTSRPIPSQSLLDTLEDRTPNLPTSSSTPCFCCWAWFCVVWNIPLASSGRLSWPCALPGLLAEGASGEKKRKYRCCVSTVQQ